MEKGGAAEHEKHTFDRSCMQHSVQTQTTAGEKMECFEAVCLNACDVNG